MNLFVLKEIAKKTLRITLFLWIKPQNNFCCFYQKARLAAENNNWEEVVNLWNTSLRENQNPSYALERLPFIQILAHKQQYEDSFALSLETTDM